MQQFIYIENLTFTYEQTIDPLFDSLTFQLQKGWTAVVGPNGSGKTTLLKLLTGILQADHGSLNIPADHFYCEQRTDFIPPGFESFINSTEKEAFRLKDILAIEDDWPGRWDVLSHGERKRSQLAVALFNNPLLLAVDEPSNHLDSQSRKFIFEAFKRYEGFGLLVSHDRQLIDKLCSHTLFINPGSIDLRKCAFSVAAGEIKREREVRERAYDQLNLEAKKLKKKVHQQRQKADRADKERSKRNMRSHDHDAKSKMDLARLSGKDAMAGRLHKRMQKKLDRTLESRDVIQTEKKVRLGIFISEHKAARLFPLILPPSKLKLGSQKKLSTPELTIDYGEKIGLTGNNGSGKSTFIKRVREKIEQAGFPHIYIPQEIPVDRANAIIARVQRYDRVKKGQLMTIIKRLGSDPVRVLQTVTPSPGEVRKLLLAEGIMLNPALILMDEPTNHMDLPSVECVEQALQECGCAQLLISHDNVFLDHIVNRFWEFTKTGENVCSVIPRK